MAEFTDFMEDKIIDHMLRAQAYTPPATVYVGLFTAAPSDAGGGTEVSGGSYVRKAVTLSAASGGASSNSADVTFDQATADWGTIGWCALFDAESGGNMLMWTALDATKVINNGDTFKFNAGDLDVTVD